MPQRDASQSDIALRAAELRSMKARINQLEAHVAELMEHVKVLPPDPSLHDAMWINAPNVVFERDLPKFSSAADAKAALNVGTLYRTPSGEVRIVIR